MESYRYAANMSTVDAFESARESGFTVEACRGSAHSGKGVDAGHRGQGAAGAIKQGARRRSVGRFVAGAASRGWPPQASWLAAEDAAPIRPWPTPGEADGNSTGSWRQ